MSPDGAIGVMLNGVLLFNALDAAGRDGVAHEVQDVCQGHPARGELYHYHDVPSCLRDAATGPSTVVGWAYDGFPIVVERDAARKLPTNADLDECHGRTSPILLNGKVVTTYHYDASVEYPTRLDVSLPRMLLAGRLGDVSWRTRCWRTLVRQAVVPGLSRLISRFMVSGRHGRVVDSTVDRSDRAFISPRSPPISPHGRHAQSTDLRSGRRG